jgi:hypothetical protein
MHAVTIGTGRGGGVEISPEVVDCCTWLETEVEMAVVDC